MNQPRKIWRWIQMAEWKKGECQKWKFDFELLENEIVFDTIHNFHCYYHMQHGSFELFDPAIIFMILQFSHSLKYYKYLIAHRKLQWNGSFWSHEYVSWHAYSPHYTLIIIRFLTHEYFAIVLECHLHHFISDEISCHVQFVNFRKCFELQKIIEIYLHIFLFLAMYGRM